MVLDPVRLFMIFAGPAVMLACWWRIAQPRGVLFILAGSFAAFAILVEAVGVITTMRSINNAPLYNIYQLAEVLLVPFMVQLLRPGWRPWCALASLFGAVALIGNLWVEGTLMVLPTLGITASNVVLALLVLALLWSLAQRSERPLQQVPAFWLFLGMLVYLGASPPMLGLIHVWSTRQPELARTVWVLMPVLMLIRYLLGAWACLLQAAAVRNRSDGHH